MFSTCGIFLCNKLYSHRVANTDLNFSKKMEIILKGLAEKNTFESLRGKIYRNFRSKRETSLFKCIHSISFLTPNLSYSGGLQVRRRSRCSFRYAWLEVHPEGAAVVCSHSDVCPLSLRLWTFCNCRNQQSNCMLAFCFLHNPTTTVLECLLIV